MAGVANKIALAMKNIPKIIAIKIIAIIVIIGINITATITTRITKYTKNIIQNAINSPTGSDISTPNRKSKSVIISNGTPIIMNIPTTKTAPKTINATTRAINAKSKNAVPNPMIPLNTSVNTITNETINKLGTKNMMDGMICNTNNTKVTKIQSGKKKTIGIKVKKFQIHQSGQVNKVIGHIKAFNISPRGIHKMKLNGQKFHIILTS